jgi:allantoin racemase
MRILLVNPNTSVETTHVMTEIAREAAGDDADVEGATVTAGAPLITNEAALLEAAGHVLSLLSARDLTGVQAIIVAAFGDPGHDEAAARFPLPVIGIAQAGMAEAGTGGRRFAVVTTTPLLVDSITARARACGWGGQFAGVRLTPGDPADLMSDPARLEAAMAEACRRAEREDGAEAIVIGGGPLALVARRLRDTIITPIVEPVPAAVRAAIASGSRLG